MDGAEKDALDTCVVFTLDADWADDEILAFALDVFKKREIPVTVFATDETPLLLEPGAGVEVGIHPNFFGAADHRAVVEALLSSYPDAKGVRSHGLFEYSNLLAEYKALGLEWDCGQQLYLCQGLRPYRHPSGLVRLPMFWEDDDYFSLSPDWRIESLGLGGPGVKCFDFHPVHLYLNTDSPQCYGMAKAAGAKKARRSVEKDGVMSFLLKLLDAVERESIPARFAGSVCSWV